MQHGTKKPWTEITTAPFYLSCCINTVGNLLRSLLSKNVEARPAISRQKSTQVSCSFGDPITILEEQIHATIVPKYDLDYRPKSI